jgi:hypothetical protein
MSSNRVGFRVFLNQIKENQDLNILVDSNILISNWDELHSNHSQVKDFLEKLDKKANVIFFTTVTTKAEFLDYQRRRLITDGLLSLTGYPEISLAINSSAKISTVKGRKNTREANEFKRSQREGDDVDSQFLYFRDSEIKEIKKTFRARDTEQDTGWLKICETFLEERLIQEEQLVDELCTYLSVHKEEQKHLFNNNNVDWKNATAISAKTAMGFSDSMILNMFLETNIEYMVTLDFDLIYAAAVSAGDKKVLLPDNRIKDFKQILKKIN